MKKVLLFQDHKQRDRTISSGEKKLVRAQGRAICIVRVGEDLIAFEDECPHMSESLFSGYLNRNHEIVCPWHTYRFSLKNGQESQGRCPSLNFIEVTNEGEKTYLLLANS